MVVNMPLGRRRALSLCVLAAGGCTLSSSFILHSSSRKAMSPPSPHRSISPTQSNNIYSLMHCITWRLFGRGKGAGDEKKEKKPNKSNLPEKICVVCNRPFTWRKKWERCWDEVTCCSNSCNAQRRSSVSSSGGK